MTRSQIQMTMTVEVDMVEPKAKSKILQTSVDITKNRGNMVDMVMAIMILKMMYFIQLDPI
jgi:hypothetical protein